MLLIIILVNVYVDWNVTKTVIFLHKVARDSKVMLGGTVSHPWSVAGSCYIHLFEEPITKSFRFPKRHAL